MSARIPARWRKAIAPTIGVGLGLAALGGAAVGMAQPPPAPLAGATPMQDQPQSQPPPQAEPAVTPQVALHPEEIALLERTLAEAEAHGFEHGAFMPAGLDGLLRSPDPAARRSGQTQLVAAVLQYAKAVHAGRLDPGDFLHDWGLHPPPYDPAPDFVQAEQQGRLGPWLDSLPPPYTGYDALRRGLAVYRGIAERGGWQRMAAGDELKLGMKGPRVAPLRARLAVEDPTVTAGGSVFDAALAQAVTRAQKRYGLEPTGTLNNQTLAALNVPVGERVEQIIVNMERWRWLPRELPADRVQVNIAAAVLTVFHDETPVLSMRAVTGRPGDETPMLSSVISSVVLNPPWNVPSDIAQKELWPKERAHPGYLARNEFVVIHTPDGGVRLQQKAGDKSALGHVKFDFPNIYSVYMHDTPSHGAFASYGRMVSHGCVRLERPVVLANLVMQGDAKWTPDQIDQTIASGDTVRAPLPKPISVFLLYWTAFASADGQVVSFRSDPYDWDRDLLQRIDAATDAVT
ncbi:MAG TPA: L,D-transpeptidase family protein [Caulobacteraceae bacterium]|nr:L,D-transpeptidase family protein [Caulobacteraceae bacterium]